MGLDLQSAMLVIAYKRGHDDFLASKFNNPYGLHDTRQAWWAGFLAARKVKLPY